MIFEERLEYKPFEYPEVLKFCEKIQQTYWVHTEVNFDADMQQFKTALNPMQRATILRSLRAISQVEVAVKTFWGKLYNYLPKPEFNGLGATFAECHVEGTEILTPSGWIDFREISIGDKVIQFDPDTGLSSITRINAVVNQHYDGDIHSVTGRDMEFHVTPNHRFVYRQNGKLFKKTIGDIGQFHSNLQLQRATLLTGFESSLTDKERLWIAIQADGNERFWRDKSGIKKERGLSSNCKTYDVGVKKPRKKERLISLLTASGYTYRERVRGDGTSNFEIDVPLSDTQANLKTFDWVDLSDKDYKYCEDFIQELSEWDGCRLPTKKKCLIKYATTNKLCADKAQAIGLMAGYEARMKRYTDERKNTFNDVFVVSFIDRKDNYWAGATYNKKILPYSGKIYCVSVDSGYIITRHNDRVLFSGNSEFRHSEAYSRLLDVLGIQDFAEFLKIPVISERYKKITSVTKFKVHTPEEFCKTLAQFSLFIENASLFSQFASIMYFQKFHGVMKNVSNQIHWTSRDENIHALAGMHIINVMQKELGFQPDLRKDAQDFYEVESKVVDYIFQDGDFEHLTKDQMKSFLRFRVNDSFRQLDMAPPLEEGKSLIWFDELLGDVSKDFFDTRPTSYTKHEVSFSAEDLF